MKKIYLLFIFGFTYFLGLTQPAFKRVKVSSAISIKLSDDFIPMSDEQRLTKYTSNRIPLASFTTLDGYADLSINQNSTQWGSEIQILKDFYKSSILSMYDKVDFIQDTLTTIDNRKYIVFEFRGTVLDEDAVGSQLSLTKYIYIQYTLFENKVLLFNFNAPVNMEQKMASIANLIMQSVRIKD